LPHQVLIADFFFVCAALAWLVAGVGAKTSLDNSVRQLLEDGKFGLRCSYITSSLCWTFSSFTAVQALLDAWYPLWQWVFQPAIGVLMLGAVSPHCHGLAVLCACNSLWFLFSPLDFNSYRLLVVQLISGAVGWVQKNSS
jgi:hypothetical protein